MNATPDYKRLLADLDLARRLASSNRANTLEMLFRNLEQRCNEDLARAIDERNTAESEKEQLKEKLEKNENVAADLKTELEKFRRERDRVREAFDRCRLVSVIVGLGSAIAIFATVPFALPWHRESGGSDRQSSSTTKTETPALHCSSLAITGLELHPKDPKNGEPISVVIPPYGVFTTTISSFSLRPQIAREADAPACMFEWKVLYGNQVVTFTDTEFASDRRQVVNGEEVLLLEESKCRLALSVSSFSELEQASGDPKSFQVFIDECPYEK